MKKIFIGWNGSFNDSIKIIRKQVNRYEKLVREQAERMERAKQNTDEINKLQKKKNDIKNSR
jgi:uncharacterized membrane protein (DUF106 family)